VSVFHRVKEEFDSRFKKESVNGQS
jgi:hypothetical protein